MELRHLTTFRTVAQLQSFRRAAEALGYVQGNVTAHIQALEQELDVQLFDRLGRHITLTSAGEQLLAYAEKLLTIAAEAQSALTQREVIKGTLTVSAPDTLCIYRLPALFSNFQQRFPQVRLLFRPLSWNALQKAVSEGVIDVAFLMAQPVQSRGLIAETLLPEPILLLAAPSHPLAQAAHIQPEDLETETLLLTEMCCSYRTVFEQQLAAEGCVPKMLLEFGSIEAIKQFAMLGMGIAVLPAVSVNAELAQSKLVILPWERDFRIITQMAWHKDKWLSPAFQAFISTAREVLKEV
ncbi:LysR family transcriptional regulator [Ktedonobacter sp. SOSP1-52]|uniref:LysR family transcriptional regulator n=1 Tax=Ktedonobacter sp. SOSP1-52 TaxID=2778366 RepID=UPI001915C091|nr:LysR family transcriptional regulator [Ktedonobacter sp. SOSP1-52]GHO69509.1 LysR family transcriptional regulator [Ktedonobacter sp. SOSP1-52]